MQTMSGNYPAILHDDMLLTDVGSVKTGIHEQIQKFPDLERHFIGGHPMCGTEHVAMSIPLHICWKMHIIF